MIIMIIVYYKLRIWLVIFVIFIFSIIIGLNSLNIDNVPLNPYISIFFIFFQMSFFIIRSIEIYKKKKNE